MNPRPERIVLPVGAIVVMPGGEAFRVQADGSLEPVLPGGHPRPGLSHATAVRR